MNRDRGAATVETVLFTPLLMVGVLLLVQLTLVYHARHALLAAAQEGARAARVERGSAASGRIRALDYLQRVAPGLLAGTSATATRTATEARVTVSGTPVRILPWLPLRLTATSAGPIERFFADAAR